MPSDPPSSEAAESEQHRLMSRFGRRFAPGEAIFREAEPANSAYLLQQGKVRLLKRVGAVDHSLRILKPGDLFGESALVPGSTRSSSAIALNESVALALDQATFQQILANHPEVGTRVLQQLIRRLRDAEDQIEISMLRDPDAKIVALLVKLAEHAVSAKPDRDGPITINITPLELSTRAGVDVDAVKRMVKQLRERDYLTVVSERLQLRSVQPLKSLYVALGFKDQVAGPERQSDGTRRSNR